MTNIKCGKRAAGNISPHDAGAFRSAQSKTLAELTKSIQKVGTWSGKTFILDENGRLHPTKPTEE